MSEATRIVATALVVALIFGLLVAAWDAYRTATLLLQMSVLPLCG